jgi:hypothetical protein
MNEQMQNALAELISKTVDSAEAVVAFGQQEIPVVIEQLLMWKFAEAVLYSVVSATVIIVFLASWYLSKRKCEKTQKDTALYEWKDYREAANVDWDNGFPIFYFMFGATASAFLALVLVDSLKTMLYISVAPKVYLLEYGASLVK